MLWLRWLGDQLYGIWISFFPPKEAQDAGAAKTPPAEESGSTEP